MKPVQPTSDRRTPLLEQEQAEVADLAARVVALPKLLTADGRTAVASRRVSWLRRGFWWLCYGAAWLTTVLLAVVAALRIFDHDGTLVLCWLNAFTRYVYLPAYACLAWAAWQRRWLLALYSLAVVACHITWMAPNFLRDRRFDAPANAAALADAQPTVRIMFANVLTTSPEYDSLWKEVSEVNPDVLVLAESSHRCMRSLRESPLMRAWRTDEAAAQFLRGEVVILSRLPIKAEMHRFITDRIVRTADLQVGSQTLRLIGLHAPRPIYPPQYYYDQYWAQVIPMLTSEQGPTVIVGDFNATEHSRVYKQLKAARLRSAHDDRGRGYATTWPNGKLLVPPIRIDQAFLSPEVECLTVAEGQGQGSDHKPIIVDVRIRTDSRRSAPLLDRL